MKKYCFLLLILVFVFSFNSAAQDEKENKGIAPGYSAFKGTLLVLECRSFVDNTLNRMTERRLDKNYKGDYEMITAEDITSKGYSNKTKYRFVVQLRNARNVMSRGPNGTSVDETKFVMTDRLTGTEYETRVYTNWTHLMNQYIDLLEKLRNKD